MDVLIQRSIPYKEVEGIAQGILGRQVDEKDAGDEPDKTAEGGPQEEQ